MRLKLSAALIYLTLFGVAPAHAASAPQSLGPDHKLPHGGRPIARVAFPAIRDWRTLKITLSRSPCFGTCPAYSVEIDGDGRVSYVGDAHVGVIGPAAGRILRAQVRLLYDAFRKAQFFWLYDSYRAQVTDLPQHTIAIAYDGHSKQVLDYYGVAIGMPQAVADLEALIDKTAGTQKWIKGGDMAPRSPKD